VRLACVRDCTGVAAESLHVFVQKNREQVVETFMR
jgi:hypothetical protein